MAMHFYMMLLASALIGVDGHAMLYEPPSRVTNGIGVGSPNCAGVSCWWANGGTKITGPPTIPFQDATYGTMFFNKDTYCQTNPLDCNSSTGGEDNMVSSFIPDIVSSNPWRHPGNATLTNPCGTVGWGGVFSHPDGTLGTNVEPLLKETTWVAGSTVEVAWGFAANHGGGYQFRLCKVSSRKKDITSEATETCFQSTPLAFVGDKTWLQWGWGMDVNNRTEIPAVRVSTGTTPAGSTWTRMPIPTCNDIPRGGLRFHACAGPMFTPPVPGLYGPGPGSCHGRACSPSDLQARSMPFGIVDKVMLPARLAAGNYILSLRWDVEQVPSVFSQCSDVKIKVSGPATKPFSPWTGCETCCTGPCASCSDCRTLKTGNCARCWAPETGKFSFAGIPGFQCLGLEAADGGPSAWQAGSAFDGVLWSPGCPKCWDAGASACAVSDRMAMPVPTTTGTTETSQSSALVVQVPLVAMLMGIPYLEYCM